MKTNPILAGFLAAALGVGLTACGGDPTAVGAGQDTKSDAIVVGSASFPESEILAEIYAGALKAEGFDASTRLDIGEREAYIGAIRDGSIDLFPEYTGNLLGYFDPKATATAPDAVNTALEESLPKGLDVLEPSAAEDKDSLNVTAAFAKEHGVASIADLAKVEDLKLAANPAFKVRAYGIPGLEKLYGITGIAFTSISDFGGPATVKALTSGKVDVADIYSTTPSIVANDLVTLEDPKNLIAAQNVIPLIREDANSEKVADVLDAVSAKLTTEALLELNTTISGPSKPSAAKVAAQWLKDNGFA